MLIHSEKCITKMHVITSLVFLVSLDHTQSKVSTTQTRLKQSSFPQQTFFGEVHCLSSLASLDEVSFLLLAITEAVILMGYRRM